MVGGVGLLLAFSLYVINVFFSLPRADEISSALQAASSTQIYDRTGKVLLYDVYGEKKRTEIPPEEIPDFVRQATISIEDESFYRHPAFDWRGIVRALTVNLIRGRVAQGGSTITQQLAKNAFLTPERTISRKIKELILAVRLEQRYSKDEILNLYLNHIPYGPTYYGAEAASQAYFNKPAKELTLAESALLAALPRSPVYYSPWGTHLGELLDRKDFVLKRMRDLDYIDDQQLSVALGEKIKIADQPRGSIKAPHFAIYVQDYLALKYGEDRLRSEGFKVTTTLDWELQQMAEEAVAKGAERNNRLYGGANAALMAMDPQTGQILAMVGSKDYFDPPEPEGCIEGKTCRFEGNFNVPVQGLRQPGSAFKPFAYLTAFLKRGLTPETIIWDAPTEFNTGCPATVDYSTDGGDCYHPQNFDRYFRGPVKLKEALAQSINVPAVKVLYVAGLNDTLETAARFGITTLNDPSRYGLSLVLGGGEIRMIELLNAYSTLAADGVYRKATPILRVEDGKGKILEEYKEGGYEKEEVVDPQYPRLINNILSSVSLRAPLFKASLDLTQVPGYEVALKTGTTDDYRDAWAFGYSPTIAIGVWAGNNNQQPLVSQGSSILAAVPIWHDFASRAIPKRPTASFNQPGPISSDNPALRGVLSGGELHDLLYYLGRGSDPQSSLWEAGVRSWLTSNSVDLSRFSTESGESGQSNYPPSGQISIEIKSPMNGVVTRGSINLHFEAKSENPISRIEVYLNDDLVDEVVDDLGKEVSYKKTLIPSGLKSQNLLVVRVIDNAGTVAERELSLFTRP